MLDYPVTVQPDDNDTILVRFPDFPEAQTFGDNVTDALAHAKDALATAIDAYIKDKRALPPPSARGQYRVPAPALLVAKAQLYETMRQGKVGKAELARRMDVHLPQVDRLLDVRHGSQVGQLEAAFAALGKRLTMHVESAPAAPRAPRRRPSTKAVRRVNTQRAG